MGNKVMRSKKFYVSYNPNPCAGMSFFAPDSGWDETALCVDGSFKILNGDFRNEYEEAFPSLEKCLEVYEKHKESADSSWSTESGG